MATNNSFMDMDFSKYMDFGKLAGQFRVPGVDPSAVFDGQRKNIEAFSAANRVALEGIQAVAQRQAEILRQAMEESTKAVQELATVGSAEEKFARQADLLKQAYETALSNVRELAEMGTKSNTAAANVINKRVTESLDELKASIKKTAK